MSDVAIRVENLSKLYHIGTAQQRHDTLRDVIADWGSSIRNRMRHPAHLPSNSELPPSSSIWALKDVSFEVKRGEVIGVIGRNGAGKSTLLKILSRITEPTAGRAIVNGRVGSLLEVGTGFHPELTGRENIYLNGAILGMRRAEIGRKFEEIVAFAEIERFLDTPVKHYSSGMYVRLAFAVAAHLEPDILLVDEVLAVGDIAFQKKCLGKMGDVAGEGRTVLFVSHNMAAVATMCAHAYWFDAGRVREKGATGEVIERYVRSLQDRNGVPIDSIKEREGSGRLRFSDFEIQDQNGQMSDTVTCGSEVTFELAYVADDFTTHSKSVVMSIAFFNLLGQPLFLCRSDLQGTIYNDIPKRGSVFCRIPKLPLPPGDFRVNLQCEIDGQISDWIRDARVITVTEGDFYGSGRIPSRSRGDLLVDHRWLAAKES